MMESPFTSIQTMGRLVESSLTSVSRGGKLRADFLTQAVNASVITVITIAINCRNLFIGMSLGFTLQNYKKCRKTQKRQKSCILQLFVVILPQEKYENT